MKKIRPIRNNRALKFRLEQLGATPADLAKTLGSRKTID